jgi:hypothetical protein
MEPDEYDDPESLADELCISLHALTRISMANTTQLRITTAGENYMH